MTKRKKVWRGKPVGTVYCPACGTALLADKTVISRHIQSEHSSNLDENDVTMTLTQKEKPEIQTNENHLILHSKRGSKLDEWHCCANCGRANRPVWRYSKSSFGVVHICVYCKPEVCNRSFGSIDVLDTNAVYRGGFEAGRRRR